MSGDVFGATCGGASDTRGGIVTLGESMALLSPAGVGLVRHARSLELGVAGAESNVAIGAVRMGCPASWIGRVGADEFGELVAMTLLGQGVDTHIVLDTQAPTGVMLKERRNARSSRVQYYRTGSAGSRLCPGDVEPALIRSARVLHVTGITCALSRSARAAVFAAVEEARAAGIIVSLDPNYRHLLWSEAESREVLNTLLPSVDVLLASEAEARILLANTTAADPSESIAALSSRGPRHVIIKYGARGALASVDSTLHAVPALPVEVVDPIGAGDAFAAAYLAGLCQGVSTEQRLADAAAAGAFAVTVPGDWEGLPTRDELPLLAEAADGVQR